MELYLIWKANNTLLNNPEIKGKIKKETRKYFY